MAGFPESITFTVTNQCNLRCRMCGQWGVEGYFKGEREVPAALPAATWNRLADEIAAHGRTGIGIRGGEPFLHPEILDILSHIKGLGLHVWMDTNGTLLDRHADNIVRIGVDHFNVSVDGPEPIHDRVRGVPGTFARIARGVAALKDAAAKQERPPPGLMVVFTISADSYRGLGAMPDVVRSLGIPGVCIVPYYYFDRKTGEAYEKVMSEELGCEGGSWRGFHRETSGVDGDEFAEQLRRFQESLGDVQSYPFMKYTESDYRHWFADCTTRVGKCLCRSPWKRMDIQPGGDANFCVDFPDYAIGNVADRTIEEVWNGDRADRFRARYEREPLPICNRCGVKYMSGGEPA